MATKKTMQKYKIINPLRERGETLESIGKRFGLTRERIRQIIKAGDNANKPDPRFKGDPLGALNTTPRVRNWLLAAGIDTLDKARKATDEQLLRIPNFGETSLKALRKAIAEHHLLSGR